MTNILYFESVSGVAGDMFSASFVDAGIVSERELKNLVEELGLTGVEVVFSKVDRAGISSMHLNVLIHNDQWQKKITGQSTELHAHHHGHDHGHHHHLHHDHGHDHESNHWHVHYRDLNQFLDNSKLDQQVKVLAQKILRNLAEAEAKTHGVTLEEVSFHEVGTVDSVLDVVMAAYCIIRSGVQRFYSSPLKLGRGFIKMEHGTYPVPPPATARLSAGMPIGIVPSAIERENIELSTPTGVAILKTLEPQFLDQWPSGNLDCVGFGAGTMSFPHFPNVFRLVKLQESHSETAVADFESDEVVELCTNIDDMSSEDLAWLSERLFEAGAVDVWQTPSTGKKGRVLILMSALVTVSKWKDCAEIILKESSSFGVRYRRWDRLKLVREFENRTNESGDSYRVKVGYTKSGVRLKEKPEFEDLKKIRKKSIK